VPQHGSASALPRAAFHTFFLGPDFLIPIWLALMLELEKILVRMLLY